MFSDIPLLIFPFAQYLFTKQKLLSAEYREYLTEIFKLADSDNDGGLTEDDLQNLAVIVKNEPIGPHQIDWFFETFETNEQVRNAHIHN